MNVQTICLFSLKQSSDNLLWLWESKSGKKTNLCCEHLCTNTDIEGSIVHCTQTHKNYIIPLCSKHRNSEKEISLSPGYELVEFS
ncbi:MAG: hypothetical protein V4622_07540 [Bacteroidota bacterium]